MFCASEEHFGAYSKIFLSLHFVFIPFLPLNFLLKRTVFVDPFRLIWLYEDVSLKLTKIRYCMSVSTLLAK